MFHGFNSVRKAFPWYEPQVLNPQRIKDTADFGFNVIRLGAMWAGVEPEEGKINQTYVDILKTVVEEYAKQNVYILLDMHQDVLWQAGTNENQGYWGVPKWVKDKLEMPSRLFPWPFIQIQGN